MSKKHVRMLDLAFQSFAVFLGFPGRNPYAHNLAYARRLDYAHAGLFMCAHELAPKP